MSQSCKLTTASRARVDEKAQADDGGAKGTQIRQRKRTGCFVQTSREGVAKGELHVIIGMFQNVQNSTLQVDAHSTTSVHTNAQQNLLMHRNIQHRLPFTFHRTMNDSCNCGECSRMTRPNTE